MRLSETKHGIDMIQTATRRQPFGAGFTADEVERATSMEIWVTDFKDPGPDRCEFVLKNADGKEIGRRVSNGY